MRVKVIPEQQVFVTCDGQQFPSQAEAVAHIEQTAFKLLVNIRTVAVSAYTTPALLKNKGFIEKLRDLVRYMDDLAEEG